MNSMENSLIETKPDIENNDFLIKRINDLMTEEGMKEAVACVWRGESRVADIAISPEDTELDQKIDHEVWRNKIMTDTENLLKDLGLCYLRKPNDYAEGYGIEEFMIAKNQDDLELFRKNKEIIYNNPNSDTQKEQSIVDELLGINIVSKQEFKKAA